MIKKRNLFQKIESLILSRSGAVGIPDKMMKYVFLAFFMPAVIIAFVTLVTYYRTPYIPEGLEPFIISERFANTCFAREDAITGRIYPDTIDISRFKKENLDECYYFSEEFSKKHGKVKMNAYRLKLNYGSGNDAELTTSNWYPKKKFKVLKTKQVLVWDGTAKKAASLRIDYQKP